MALHDDLRTARRCAEELGVCVARIARELGDSPEIRRVRTDAVHLRESLALLNATAPGGAAPPEVIGVPDTPYDQRLWRGADDEGLGARYGPGGV